MDSCCSCRAVLDASGLTVDSAFDSTCSIVPLSLDRDSDEFVAERSCACWSSLLETIDLAGNSPRVLVRYLASSLLPSRDLEELLGRRMMD